jgi:hypothetical protein
VGVNARFLIVFGYSYFCLSILLSINTYTRRLEDTFYVLHTMILACALVVILFLTTTLPLPTSTLLDRMPKARGPVKIV